MKRYTFDDEDNRVPYMPSVEWKVGDTITLQMPGIDPYWGRPYTRVFRKIAKVRSTGYSWYYPEYEFKSIVPSGAENHFYSENSNDPFLEHMWEKVETINK